MSTGFVTLLLFLTVAGVTTLLVKEPIWSWQLSVLFICTNFITATVWIIRGKDLKEFTVQIVKRICNI